MDPSSIMKIIPPQVYSVPTNETFSILHMLRNNIEVYYRMSAGTGTEQMHVKNRMLDMMMVVRKRTRFSREMERVVKRI